MAVIVVLQVDWLLRHFQSTPGEPVAAFVVPGGSKKRDLSEKH
jgi:hypothetical protein